MGTPLAQGVLGCVPPPLGDIANSVTTGSFSAIGPSAAVDMYGPFNVSVWASVIQSLTVTSGSLAFSVPNGATLAVGSAVASSLVPAGTTVATLVANAGTLALPPISLEATYTAGISLITNLPQTNGLVGATIVGPVWPAGTTVLSVAVPFSAGPNGQNQRGTVVTSAPPTLSSEPPGVRVGGIGQNRILFQLGPLAITTGTDPNASFTGSGIKYVATVELDRSFDGGNNWITANAGGTGTLAQYSAGTPVTFIAGECERGVAYRLNCIAYTSGVINYRISTTGQAATSLGLNATV
jgi:hypothetical protein